ncbi:DUF1788 domain-containing protein [uncultured Rubinisphaera sp.]|uniref:DUF1788 domain-containing protein n=1 Tax=uncultured Rubinisphaera sp. TaxID=1678686 RepID=UPI0030DC63C8
MNQHLKSAPIADRFDHLLSVIGSQRFLRMEGIGKEVPFFVVPFDPSVALEMDKLRGQLIRKLKHKGIRVLEIDLYDLSKELMDELGDWDFWIENEAKHDKRELLEAIQSLTDPETKLAPAIVTKMEDAEFDVTFLCGIGEVYPFIRSHTVLNNLQSVAKEQPLVMFFPGDYSHSLEEGASLDIFGRLRDDKYYRAFNLYDREA